ncbi:hypothetical protein HX776_06860 [Pseudomonas agarici]|uniref:hypothetical protein n=1 Tax=Pseudomonas agarici TaxID=46677 RepID=UPI0008B98F83|nr:hypothetical protein [Pseudomonas agarici]NWC08543.1 hypothetical protein [Pseudomonas agarici]SEL24204.1 hypothetical protein SAMN05216604_11412 [Pseudomonas agarici]
MSRRMVFLLLGTGLLLALLAFARFFVAYIPVDYLPAITRSSLMPPKKLEFMLGEKGDAIVQRSNFTIQHSGVSSALFYTVRNAQFSLKHPQHALIFPPASTVLFYDDASDNYGVDEVKVRVKLTDTPILNDTTEPQIEAYDRQVYDLVMSLQASIQTAGWQRFIMPGSPRLIGRSSYLFEKGYLNEPNIADIGLYPGFLADPNYQLTWEDWRQLREGFFWQWQADGMLLEVDYTPGTREKVRNIPIFDSLNITLQTSSSLSGASHPNEATRTKYAGQIHQVLLKRIAIEAKARAAGLPILESYRDPTMVSGVPVPSMESVAKAEALKQAPVAPPEPVLRKAAGEACPKSGWWFTPARLNSRRYFQQGATFPAIEGSDYGETFCSVKYGCTLSFNRSAAVMGVFVV